MHLEITILYNMHCLNYSNNLLFLNLFLYCLNNVRWNHQFFLSYSSNSLNYTQLHHSYLAKLLLHINLQLNHNFLVSSNNQLDLSLIQYLQDYYLEHSNNISKQLSYCSSHIQYVLEVARLSYQFYHSKEFHLQFAQLSRCHLNSNKLELLRVQLQRNWDHY